MKKAVFFLGVLLLALAGCQISDYSEGTRIGLVYKFSHKGVFCKTWEGSANLGGMREESTSDGKSTQMVPNTWNFTVKDSDYSRFGPVIEQALESGQMLKFTYQQEWPAYCDSEDGYLVKSVVAVR